MIDSKKFYINGAWVAPLTGSESGREMDVIDPSTEQVCAVISIGGQADTDAAVAAAKAALDGAKLQRPSV
jgi:aldehyde dehydrogenase (NAD+)